MWDRFIITPAECLGGDPCLTSERGRVLEQAVTSILLSKRLLLILGNSLARCCFPPVLGCLIPSTYAVKLFLFDSRAV